MDTQTVFFANTGVKHAAITMADVGAKTVHVSLRTLRVQALRVGTGPHGRTLDVLTKDIPITSSILFGGDLGKLWRKPPLLPKTIRLWGTVSYCQVCPDPSHPEA